MQVILRLAALPIPEYLDFHSGYSAPRSRIAGIYSYSGIFPNECALNINYLLRILHEFNFGPSFIQWIDVLYNNASSCVMNHGFSTGPFPLGRGVRQGDPLSPYLFIMALEVLAIRVRNDKSIQGFKIGDETVKLSLLADDMTCFLKDKLSYINLFRLLKAFGECSGLKVNHEKTEALALSDNSLWEDLSNMYTLCNVIKILGIHFGSNDKERDDLNFRETLTSIKKSIHLWKWTGIGRIQIIKTFAIPKLMFRASVIPISKELIKKRKKDQCPLDGKCLTQNVVYQASVTTQASSDTYVGLTTNFKECY